MHTSRIKRGKKYLQIQCLQYSWTSFVELFPFSLSREIQTQQTKSKTFSLQKKENQSGIQILAKKHITAPSRNPYPLFSQLFFSSPLNTQNNEKSLSSASCIHIQETENQSRSRTMHANSTDTERQRERRTETKSYISAVLERESTDKRRKADINESTLSVSEYVLKRKQNRLTGRGLESPSMELGRNQWGPHVAGPTTTCRTTILTRNKLLLSGGVVINSG